MSSSAHQAGTAPPPPSPTPEPRQRDIQPSGRRHRALPDGHQRSTGRCREDVTTMPPVVNSVTPNQGSSAGGTSVTITGSGFAGSSAARFGGTEAAGFVLVSSTKITAISPPGMGTVNVTVTGSSGTSTQTIPFTYVNAPAPIITALTPNTGPETGGTIVTITGSGFTGATSTVRNTGVQLHRELRRPGERRGARRFRHRPDHRDHARRTECRRCSLQLCRRPPVTLLMIFMRTKSPGVPVDQAREGEQAAPLRWCDGRESGPHR
jgi:hypothetical protein